MHSFVFSGSYVGNDWTFYILVMALMLHLAHCYFVAVLVESAVFLLVYLGWLYLCSFNNMIWYTPIGPCSQRSLKPLNGRRPGL